MTHARVSIFPVRVAAGAGGRSPAAVSRRINRSGPSPEGDPGPTPSSGSPSRSAVGAAARAAGGDGRRVLLGGDRTVVQDGPAGAGHLRGVPVGGDVPTRAGRGRHRRGGG